jgi:hypothetical protein
MKLTDETRKELSEELDKLHAAMGTLEEELPYEVVGDDGAMAYLANKEMMKEFADSLEEGGVDSESFMLAVKELVAEWKKLNKAIDKRVGVLQRETAKLEKKLEL